MSANNRTWRPNNTSTSRIAWTRLASACSATTALSQTTCCNARMQFSILTKCSLLMRPAPRLARSLNLSSCSARTLGIFCSTSMAATRKVPPELTQAHSFSNGRWDSTCDASMSLGTSPMLLIARPLRSIVEQRFLCPTQQSSDVFGQFKKCMPEETVYAAPARRIRRHLFFKFFLQLRSSGTNIWPRFGSGFKLKKQTNCLFLKEP
jgi:hypothetical protein